MRWVKRSILPLLCGLLVGLPILWWPEGPLWTRSLTRGSVMGFSQDESSLFYLENFFDRSVYQKQTPISFVECDTRTGAEKRRVTFAVDSDFQVAATARPEDFTTLVVYGSRRKADSRTPAPGTQPVVEYVCYLFDMKDGKLLDGPWDCTNHQDVLVSPDSKWLYLPGPHSGNGERKLLSLPDGKIVYQARPQALSACFAKDGKTLASLLQDSIVVVDLETGKELHSHKLPPAPVHISGPTTGAPAYWHRLWDWDGRIARITTFWENNRMSESAIWRFEVGNDGMKSLGQEPERRLTWSDGKLYQGHVTGDTVRYYLPGLAAWPEWITSWVAWIDKTFGTGFVAKQQRKSTFAFYDTATNRMRRAISLNGFHSVRVSPNGRYFAAVEFASQNPTTFAVKTWDLSSPPRWPFAWGAGLAAGLAVLGLRRWIARRKHASPAASHGSNHDDLV